jgi:very-short-patch-repair endonuclease
VRRQHWAVSLPQLLSLGFTYEAVRHRVQKGRLHPIHRGVYAVGRNHLTRHGLFMAAVLACGAGAALSHESAAELWGIRLPRLGPIEVTAPTQRRHAGITAHRGRPDITYRHGIPVTTVVQTLIDLAPRLTRAQLERAIGEADLLGLADPEQLRNALESRGREAAVLRKALDRRTFRLTRSDLERIFIPIALRAGLQMPETRAIVNGFEVDFWWPDLGLVVESDSLKYHRTAAKQARDRLRDQAHIATGLTCLRFTDEQIAHDPPYIEQTLRRVAANLRLATLPGRVRER